jgi:hypothetical protein
LIGFPIFGGAACFVAAAFRRADEGAFFVERFFFSGIGEKLSLMGAMIIKR